jgi:catechol 2,3-dioxygenase-like lactoylglutathione lyase family enzyme
MGIHWSAFPAVTESLDSTETIWARLLPDPRLSCAKALCASTGDGFDWSQSDPKKTRFLEKRGEGVHHIALRVEDAEEAIRRLKEAGLKPVEGRSQTGAMGLAVAFIHPTSCHGVLMEICEESKTRGKQEDGHL